MYPKNIYNVNKCANQKKIDFDNHYFAKLLLKKA